MARFEHIRQHLKDDFLKAWDVGVDLASRSIIREMTSGRNLPPAFEGHVDSLSGERLESLFATVVGCHRAGDWTEFETEIDWMWRAA